MEKKRAAFLNLGCKVNSYETDAMKKLFADAGYETVSFQEEAEVYVINTCSVTNIADRKSRQMLHRARKQHPQAVIVAAGCYVQTAPEEAAADLAVDIIIGNNRKAEIVAIVEDYWKNRDSMDAESSCKRDEDIETKEERHRREEKNSETKKENAQREEHGSGAKAGNEGRKKAGAGSFLEDLSVKTEYEPLFITDAGERTRASIKIQDGCNQFCSYCIIPYARGRIRSRRPDDIEKEVNGLVKKGYQEIVLTGIHLSSYGMDFVKEGEEPRSHLLEVIQELSWIEGLKRIRLGSLEPNIITEEFVKTLADNPKFCPHFHLSLQSGCNETLKRMNRHYTAEEYLEKCRLLRKYFDMPAITTDVIVGFPGETQEDFMACKSFLETVSFSQMHIFQYSKRKGTRAERMPDQIPEEVKKQRSEILLALESELRHYYWKQFIGKRQQILLEETAVMDGKTYWTGHNERYMKTAILKESEEDLSNQIVEAEITGMMGEHMMLGRTDKR